MIRKALFWFLLLGHIPVFAQQLAYIPDPNFRAFIKANYPGFMVGDSLIVDSAATVKETFDCSGQGIRDLTGIEYFINITDLRCSYNQLTFLPDLSSITGLKFLFCEGNQLTALPDLSNLIYLTGIWCGNNQLEQLPDLSNLSQLQILNCSNNRLTSLPDLSNNTNLTQLYSSGNELTELPDLSALNQLSVLWVYENKLLRMPDLSRNINLTDLRCYQNHLTEIPGISALKNLIYLDCSDNQLESLGDLTGMTHLRTLDVRNNEINQLPDLSASQQLEYMYCQQNRLDFSDARELKIIDRLPNLLVFEYAPQKPFGRKDTVVTVEYFPLQFGISPQDSATEYEWYKNGTRIPDWHTPQVTLPSVQLSDSGTYRVRVYGTALTNMNHGPGITDFISQPLVLRVLPGNRPPQFLTQTLDTAAVAHEYRHLLQATDPNGDSLRFAAIEMPNWLHLQDNGLLWGIPGIADTGTHPLQVEVLDNGTPVFRDTLDTEMVVVLRNRPPRLLPPKPDTALVMRQYRVELNAADPDGDSLNFIALQLPGWLRLEQGRWLVGTPTMADTGTNPITIAVQDHGIPPLADTLSHPLTVTLGNSVPRFLTTRLDTAYEDTPYEFQIQVSDAEGDSVIFWATSIPEWLSLSPTGRLHGTPSLSDTGTYLLMIHIKDTGIPPLSDSLAFSLTVAINPDPPKLTFALLQNPALTRHAQLVLASDVLLKQAPDVVLIAPGDTTTISMTSLGETQRLYRGKIEFRRSGVYRVVAQAVRLNGTTSTQSRDFSVLKIPSHRKAVLESPDARARLIIPETRPSEETYVVCFPDTLKGKPVYRFSPTRRFDQPFTLEMRYDDLPIQEARKLFIYRRQGESWSALPSVVHPDRKVVRSSISQLGDFRVQEDPDYQGSNLVPLQVRLMPNYPNPFNPITTIEYHLAADGWVSLTIFNALGQKVRTLVNRSQPAGSYRIQWDGKNDRGQRLPSGLYYYQLRTQESVLTRRMVLIR